MRLALTASASTDRRADLPLANLSAKDEELRLVPSKLEQSDGGYVLLSCDFYGDVIDASYVVVTRLNRISNDHQGVGDPDSAAVQVFVGGRGTTFRRSDGAVQG